MSARQLGQHVRLKQTHITRVEQGEIRGSTSLNTLKNIAHALDCEDEFKEQLIHLAFKRKNKIYLSISYIRKIHRKLSTALILGSSSAQDFIIDSSPYIRFQMATVAMRAS